MRVAQINTFFINGGSTGRIVYSLSQTLNEKGIDNCVIYGVGFGEDLTTNAHLIQSRTYKRINELKARILGNHGFNNFLSTKHAIAILDAFKPDIVHIHNLHGSYINLELLFKYLNEKEIPVVITLHDAWLFTGRCACFDLNECNKWMVGCGNCAYKKQYPSTWLLDNSKENFIRKKKAIKQSTKLTVVVPSMWMLKETRKSFLSGNSVMVINNGIDISCFKPMGIPKKKQYGIEKMILACAYNWTVSKGVQFLPRIAGCLENGWKLVVIGNVPKSIKRDSRIVCVPNTKDKNELALWYSSADVFINPTLEDNFPTVNIECLACGTPCVTFDTGGAGEIVDENTGVVIPKNDWEMLVKKALSIHKEELTHNCVKRARDKYSESYANDKYVSLYKSLAYEL